MQLQKRTVYVAAASFLVVGVAIAYWASPSSSSSSSGLFPGDTPNASDIATRVQHLERTLDQTLKIQGQLLELVNELSARLDPDKNSGETRNASLDMAHAQSEAEFHNSHQEHDTSHQDRFERMRENQIRQLMEAGFGPERAQFIVDKQERIQYEQMQFTYEYHHLQNKRSAEAKQLQEKIHTYSNPRRVFEEELSRSEFDQYLKAFGGRTELEIGDLLEAAPAYEAGLRPGDKIIRYNNQRVFHMGDLRTQVYQVAPGSSVSVEIQRRGSSASETIYLPAGPLGIRG
ncbi:PDZ domain-containing protein [Microbulbifer sp. ALW1]|uniref:PDZ domain-containing protein n=1 Tax=Microbulbifer sp. (strain ALW1) TaxID=1516059 RepID=UPI00135AE245|nr:PDZ domain-containing protein [Microbulbifer sp. ALW1]